MTDTRDAIEFDRDAAPLQPVSARAPLASRRVAGGGLAASAARAFGERRLFVLLPFAIIAGLILNTAAGAEPQPMALGTVAGALAVALALARHTDLPRRMILVALAGWLGFSLLPIHGALFGTEMLGRAAYGTYEARIDEVISEGVSGRRVVVSGIVPLENARALPIRRARIFAGEGAHLAPGDIVRGRVRFYPVPGPVLPGGFDSQFHGYFEGIGAYANTIGPLEIVSAGEATAPARIVDGIRGAIAARIDAALSQPAAGIARALITGDQSAVDEGAREVMAVAGLAHVLSVSGLHLTIVAGGVFAALRLLLALSEGVARRVPVKRIAAVGGIVAALLYFAISGGNVAALRATVMILLVFGAVIAGRRALTMRNVALAALVVLLSDPASVFRPSFQLSFAAVVALIGAWELARRDRHEDRSLVQHAGLYFGGLAATSLVAGAATLLFSAYHFQQTSPLGVIGNLASLPLVGFVTMPAAVFAVLAMPFGLEGPFLSALGWSIERMLDLAGLVGAWSTGIDASPLLSPSALAIGLAALAWFAFFRDRWRLLGPALAVPAVLTFGLDRPPDVLIADTTQAVAVRTVDGLRLVTGRSGSFATDVWAETYGEEIIEGDFACDALGCIAVGQGGFTLAVIADPAGFHEDCSAVDVVVSRRYAPSGCDAPLVIDAGDLASGGVHWLAWNADVSQFAVRPAITDLNRSWRITPR
jgi:competence protein ComEC